MPTCLLLSPPRLHSCSAPYAYATIKLRLLLTLFFSASASTVDATACLSARQVACIMAVLIERTYPSPQEAASLLVISLGVMLAVWQVGMNTCLHTNTLATCLPSTLSYACIILSAMELFARLSFPAPRKCSLMLFLCQVLIPCLDSCPPVFQGALTGKPYAIAFCIAATVCNGGFMTFSSKLMRSGFVVHTQQHLE